ncbi:MAG: hypothetical protein K8F25_11090, partial [Fimbriimonadaceae bacterium]|nr:hypothetical protein [Alphaproteobacteria bacterium]
MDKRLIDRLTDWGESVAAHNPNRQRQTLQWRSMSAALREREYSPSSVIGGDYQPFIDAYATQSARAKAQCGNIIACRYGPDPSHTIDLALPKAVSAARPCPLLVFFHGGYWQELSKHESLFPAPGCL